MPAPIPAVSPSEGISKGVSKGLEAGLLDLLAACRKEQWEADAVAELLTQFFDANGYDLGPMPERDLGRAIVGTCKSCGGPMPGPDVGNWGPYCSGYCEMSEEDR